MKIAKATIAVSPITISNMIAGFIRAKFTAVFLGTGGVGLFSQAYNFFNFFIVLASLGMRLGITKYVAKYNSEKDEERVAETISHAVGMQLAVCLLALVAIAAFSSYFSRYIFASGSYAIPVLIMSLGLPFVVLAGTFESALIGLGNYKGFARGRVFVTALSLIPLFIFILVMKVKGTFWYIVAAALINFSVFYYLMFRYAPRTVFSRIFAFKRMFGGNGERKRVAGMLLTYGGASFITGGLGLFCVVFMRTLLIKYFGLEANGLYQVVFAVSSYYLALFTNGLWSYYYPRASAISDEKESAREMNTTIRFCILGVVPFAAGIYLLRYAVIRILFSSKFLPSAELFSAQLFGDYFLLLFYLFGISLLAREKIKVYIVFALLYSISFVGLFMLLAPHAGLKAMPLAYLMSNVLGSVAMGIYHTRCMRIKISRRNIMLFFATVFMLSIIFFIGGSGPLMFLSKSVFLISCFIFLMTKEEKDKALRFISTTLSRG